MASMQRLTTTMDIPVKLIVGMAMPNAKMVRSRVSESAQG